MFNNPKPADAGDTIAVLLMAAQEDPAFRERLVYVLQLPAKDRVALINSAVHEMTLRNEPVGLRQAFLLLADDRAAAGAVKVLSGS